jgi:quercetin dioxygenase-like cupin family protein
VLGSPYRFLATSAQTAGSLALIEAIAPPHSEVPLHMHTREDETFFVLEGQLKIQCGGRPLVLEERSTAFLPRNIPHSYANYWDTPAKYLVSITPGGFEKCLEEFGHLSADSRPAPETLAAIGQKYGLIFLPSKS